MADLHKISVVLYSQVIEAEFKLFLHLLVSLVLASAFLLDGRFPHLLLVKSPLRVAVRKDGPLI
jgi:hypothetical protein